MTRSPLQRKTPLKQGSKVLKRAAMKQGGKRMRSTRSTKKPTAAQALRFEQMRKAGCMCCAAAKFLGFEPTGMAVEIHHILSGGIRLGHDFTIPLCHYHHQGKRLPQLELGYSIQSAIYGPSLERESRRFAEVYGAQLDLLYTMNQYLKELPA